MPTTAYCTSADLLLGNVPVPSDAQKYIDAAAEEIDSHIGFKYQTPVVVGNSPEQRPIELLLKRLNAWLASGRLILALDGAGEDDQLHTYGAYLVTQVNETLAKIMDGSITLPGVPPSSPEGSIQTGPMMANGEEASFVDAHAEVFGNPAAIVLDRSYIVYGNPYTW